MSRTRILPTLATLLLGPACGSECPAEVEGGRIRGTVSSAGTAHLDLGRPAVGVYAFGDWPPQGPPHGSRVFEDVGTEVALEYELANLVAGVYSVMAQVMDLDNESNFAVVAGGYPSFCELGVPAVTVTDDVAATAVNIRMYGDGGGQDPCSGGSSQVDPAPGRAALAVEAVGPGIARGSLADDRLSVSRFSTWPPVAAPLGYAAVSGAATALPAVVVDNHVAPGDAAVLLCLDIGGDNMMCDGAEDYQVVFDGGAPVAFTEGEAIRLRINLETGESEEVTAP